MRILIPYQVSNQLTVNSPRSVILIENGYTLSSVMPLYTTYCNSILDPNPKVKSLCFIQSKILNERFRYYQIFTKVISKI